MKKEKLHLLKTATILIMLSTALYFFHYFIFHDTHHIFIYLIEDLAFIPLEVLLVTVIIHKVLEYREKKQTIHKLNMVVGLFFTEVGSPLIKKLLDMDNNASQIKATLNNSFIWDKKAPKEVIKQISLLHTNEINCPIKKLDSLNSFLKEKRDFLLLIIQNPNLMEHNRFTDTLWAVFHLTEELSHRSFIEKLLNSDNEHLKGDIQRVYDCVLNEWIHYMCHLKMDYPFLFSMALRTNPFDDSADITVK